MDARSRAIASISDAKLELDRAIAELDAIRSHDPAVIGIVAHALTNYVTVTTATVEMLQVTLRGYPDPDVLNWLEGIRHTADLMQHSLSRLVAISAPHDFPLKADYTNIVVFMDRACQYYRRRPEARDVKIASRAVGTIPLVWADRVALAVVADNLLANALRVSESHQTIDVQLVAEPGHVVCSIRDRGPGMTPEACERLFKVPSPDSGESPAELDNDYGLLVAHAFVHRMDGDLWCESQPGKGSCFSFRLPALE